MKIRKIIKDWWEGYVPVAPDRSLPPDEYEEARKAYHADWDANFRQPAKSTVMWNIRNSWGLILWIPFFPGMIALAIVNLVSPISGGSGIIDGIVCFIGIISLMFWAAVAVFLLVV